MFWNARCSVSSGIVLAAACSWILPVCSRSSLPVELMMFGGRRVERGDLPQHQPLVGHRLRHRHRRAQRGHGGGARTVNALHQLDVVLLDQVEREIALHADRHLGQQVLRALADVEQRALADRLGLGRIGRVEIGAASSSFWSSVRAMWIICSRLPIASHSFCRSTSIAALSISSSSLPLARRARIAWMCPCDEV